MPLEMQQPDDRAGGRAPARHFLHLRLGRGVRQIIGSVGVVFSVVTATFLVTRVFAPDPTVLFLAPAGNGYTSPAAAAAERARVEQLGLGSPLPVQYYHFILQLLHGNLGTSFQTGRPVTEDL